MTTKRLLRLNLSNVMIAKNTGLSIKEITLFRKSRFNLFDKERRAISRKLDNLAKLVLENRGK